MNNKVIPILAISFISLVGCNHPSDGNKSNTGNELVRLQIPGCDSGLASISTFTGDSYFYESTIFSNSDCTGEIEEEYSFDAAYVLGKEIMTASGITATEIDVTCRYHYEK